MRQRRGSPLRYAHWWTVRESNPPRATAKDPPEHQLTARSNNNRMPARPPATTGDLADNLTSPLWGRDDDNDDVDGHHVLLSLASGQQ